MCIEMKGILQNQYFVEIGMPRPKIWKNRQKVRLFSDGGLLGLHNDVDIKIGIIYKNSVFG